ncbi:hypothetical protein NQ317_018486 [Molorchus minor]|uniref:Uncharacterized protein n=1 Tax=Molorchus minor TaxID=1323400 RepID=A0ABQ9J362_9CUCU|nr:hypothetical protein NQ317_018486 [Molorchus minor]
MGGFHNPVVIEYLDNPILPYLHENDCFAWRDVIQDAMTVLSVFEILSASSEPGNTTREGVSKRILN